MKFLFCSLMDRKKFGFLLKQEKLLLSASLLLFLETPGLVCQFLSIIVAHYISFSSHDLL